MGRKKKSTEESLKKAILNYLQLNGWSIRDQFGVIDARLEEDPVRLVLVTSDNELKTDKFSNLVHDGETIPVEVQKVEVRPVLVTSAEGKIEKEEKPQDDQIFHHEFSEQAKKIYNIGETIGPNVTKDNVKGKNKEEVYDAWKKRHSKVKITGEE